MKTKHFFISKEYSYLCKLKKEKTHVGGISQRVKREYRFFFKRWKWKKIEAFKYKDSGGKKPSTIEESRREFSWSRTKRVRVCKLNKNGGITWDEKTYYLMIKKSRKPEKELV